MPSVQDLRDQLLRLDRQSYNAYKQIQGTYQFLGFILLIDHVQGDPFAAPSRLRVQLPQSGQIGVIPADLYSSASRSIALKDYLNRQFEHAAQSISDRRGSGNSGLINIVHPSQQVLDRSSVLISTEQIEVRFTVGLPAQGRQILAKQAAELLCDDIPEIVDRALHYPNLDPVDLQHHVEVAEDADWLRQQLSDRGLVAFVADGATLPRQSGVDDRPLAHEASPFQSPQSLRVEFDRPNHGSITGMGIPQGITLIVGGGYHGKSTLLRAIALGIYNHLPGDGRENVVTHPDAIKIRAEDGRGVAAVDVSPFINHLPQGRSTTQFSTDNASGSTSQAASIIEALEVGAKVLLVDEDTSATNFMIRDRRMQALIAKDKEPITPFIDKIRPLYQDYGVSTILVMGGSGDYFDVADRVIAMTEFQPQDVTAEARSIAALYATDRQTEGGSTFGTLTPRIVALQRLDSPQHDRSDNRSRLPKLKVRDLNEMMFGAETIDVAAIEQIVEVGQLRGIGAAIAYLQQHSLESRRPLTEIATDVISLLEKTGFDRITPYPQGNLVRFRALELIAVINRLRSMAIVSHS